MLTFKRGEFTAQIERAPEARKTVFQLPLRAQEELQKQIEARQPQRIEFLGYEKSELELRRLHDSRPMYAVFRFDGERVVIALNRMDNRRYTGRKWY